MDKDTKLFYEWVENRLENIDDESILYELKQFPEDVFVEDDLYSRILDIPEFCKKYNIDENSLQNNDLIIEGIILDLASNRMYDVKLENSVFLGHYAEDDE